MKNKLGFTLIELLAVIAIIAILAVITTPVVMQLIDKSNKGTAQNSAYGLINAAKSYYALEMEDNAVSTNVTFTFPNDNDLLPTKGKLPVEGTLIINPEGKMEMSVEYNNYCVTKDYAHDKVTVTKKGDTTCDTL